MLLTSAISVLLLSPIVDGILERNMEEFGKAQKEMTVDVFSDESISLSQYRTPPASPTRHLLFTAKIRHTHSSSKKPKAIDLSNFEIYDENSAFPRKLSFSSMDDDVTAVMNNTVNKVQRVQSNDKVDLVSEAKSEQIRLDNAVGFLPSDIQICSGIDESSNECSPSLNTALIVSGGALVLGTAAVYVGYRYLNR
ncbi:hypothetical protein DdX_03921 [Ditylenchus destructor]|uniref:Uncharacterized protein n=1 Tax=Ditylenchus destructor TaxID=166010 RepID=A0AAD4NG50_9BILA|nr:hypothetical protein DdX_03921 [Ditylenchus destructor]